MYKRVTNLTFPSF